MRCSSTWPRSCAAAELPTLLQEASKREISYADFLQELVDRELVAKQERHTQMKTVMARFPFHKTLESFDFKFQPSIDQRLIRELATGRFLAQADNVLLFGLGGQLKTDNFWTGKTDNSSAAETGEFYFAVSSVRKSVWTFVRQLFGPHLRTCA